MISSLTLADKDGNDVVLQSMATPYKRNVVSVHGLLGVPAPRSVIRPQPTGHGGIDDTKWSDGSMVSMVGEIVSQVSQEDAWAEFHAVLTPMQDTLDVGPALLKWREGAAGTLLQRSVKLASDVDPPVEQAGAILNYQAQFYAPDPRAYSQTLQTVAGSALSTASGGLVFPMTFPIKFTPSGGGTVSVTNAGNRKTPPVFRIYGGCTNPTIINLGTQERITVVGTIANGDYLEIDVGGLLSGKKRTTKLNGSTLQNNLIDSVNTTWFELARTSVSNPTGTTNLQLISGTFDGTARLDVLLRAAYA